MRVAIAAKRLVLVALLSLGVNATAGEYQPDPARGAKLYSENCGRCHNLRSPNELGDREWSVVLSHMRVVAGLPAGQARDIEAFLRQSNNPHLTVLPPVGAAAPMPSGKALIERYACQGCHVIGGEGTKVGPELDTLFKRRQEPWVRAQLRNPRVNNPTTVMPNLGLSEAEITAIIQALKAAE